MDGSYNPGDLVEVNGKLYEAAHEREKGCCTGCAAQPRLGGEGRLVRCMDLPHGCAVDRLIWVVPAPKAAEYKPAHGGYPGTVKLS